MLSKPSLLATVPKARDLKSNKLKDIQVFLDRLINGINTQYELMHQDISTLQVNPGEWIYFGGKNVVGSARIGLVGTDWVCQHFIAGTYQSRLGSTP